MIDGEVLLQAVLQKAEEEHKERSFAVLLLCLDGHSEQFCDKRCLAQAVCSAMLATWDIRSKKRGMSDENKTPSSLLL